MKSGTLRRKKYFIFRDDNPVTIDDVSVWLKFVLTIIRLSEKESAKLGKSNVQTALVDEAKSKIASMVKIALLRVFLNPW